MIDPLDDADSPDVADMSPAQVHDIWERETNLDAAELRAVRNDPRNERYLEEADGNETDDGPIPGGPLDDAIHLATTPADQWTPDEKAEARENLNFKARTLPQYETDQGEALIPDEEPDFHKNEWSLMRWGYAPEPDDAEEVLK